MKYGLHTHNKIASFRKYEHGSCLSLFDSEFQFWWWNRATRLYFIHNDGGVSLSYWHFKFVYLR